MDIKEITEQQYEYMKKDIITSQYKWEDNFLKEDLQGYLYKERKLHDYKPNKKFTEKEIKDNQKIEEINSLINKYNNNFKDNEEVEENLKRLYDEINCESWKLNKSFNFEQLRFSKKILITGPGGIGKSQYIYELYESTKNIGYKNCFLYGKYSNEISEKTFKELINEIKEIARTEKIMFVIDAINEFEDQNRNVLYDFLKEEIDNLRIIITCRDFSMEDSELKTIFDLINEKIPFAGVDSVDSIQKISEEFNIDLTKYEDIMYDNNPLHLNMIKSVISNNRLEIIRNNSIATGTDIYEQYIKNTTAKYNRNKNKYWDATKRIVEELVNNDIALPTIQDIQNILCTETTDYIEVMKREGFIDIKSDYIIFRNETLEAYLIAREILKRLPEKENDIINYLNLKAKIFNFIQEQLIIILFDKISDMKKIAKIIRNTNLKNYFGDIKLLNRIKFSEEKRKEFVKAFKYSGPIEHALFSAGGFENNPLNCINYLNNKIMENNTNFDLKCSDIDIRYTKSHLTTWTRTIATFQCSEEYLEEKFWFSIWCMSLINKDIRYLSRKMIYEIIQKDKKYIGKLIKLYIKLDDEYIKEGIIQILCSQKKDNIRIKRFINKINDENLLNFRSLYYISNYLYSKEIYTIFDKKNLLKEKNSKYKNKKIYNFLKRVLFVDKYEYSIFGIDGYGEKVQYQDKFIKEDKNKIIKVNKYINRYWNCKNYCQYKNLFKKDIIFNKYGKVNERQVSDYEIYFAWQYIFKQELDKYNIKCRDLDNLVVYSEKNKSAAYKALEIANNKVAGSIACNYYTNDFILDDWDKKGYAEYRFESHSEIIDLINPITIYSEDVENLNNKIMNQIELPENFDLEWAINRELSMSNFKNIISPINYKRKNWVMIYGSVKIIYKEKDDLKWSDEYIINLAINEEFSLSKDPMEDRKYTIETKRFKYNIDDYFRYNYKQSCSIQKSSFWNNFFVESDFNLPPTKIINEFNLTYNNSLSAWVDNEGNKIIIISNNKDSWYKNGVTGSIFMDKEYYDILKNKYDLKYFAFTERFFEHYRDESSLQIEYKDNTIKSYLHYVEGKSQEKKKGCEECKIYQKGKKNQNRGRKSNTEEIYARIINDLGYSKTELESV